MAGYFIKKHLHFGFVCDTITFGRQRPMIYPGVAQFGRALEWGSRGRWFDSSHSDQPPMIRWFFYL